MEDIRHELPGYTVRALKDLLSIYTSTNIPGLQSFINAMIALAISIGLLVIFLTMYTTVMERTRDIGVLKSLGAGRWFIVRALLTESAALCGLGILAGVGLGYVGRAGFLSGLARRESRSTARRIGGGDGPFGLWQIFAVVCDRRGGASFPGQSAGRRQRPHGTERCRALQIAPPQDRLRLPAFQFATHADSQG